MKVKNKLKGKIIVGIAIITVLSILSSNMLNIVHATSTMQKNDSAQTVTIKDNYGRTISLTNPTNPTAIKNLEGLSSENGVQYEKVDLSNENEESSAGGNEGSNIGTVGTISTDEMTRLRDTLLSKNQFSDPAYSFSFTLDENTVMQPWKDVNITEYKKDDTDITFFPDSEDKNSKFGVYIYNAGLYLDSEGKVHNINLKLTFSWETWLINNQNQYPYINIRTYSKGQKKYGLYFSFCNMTYATKIDIYEGDPTNDNNKIKINMNIKLVDIDDRQFFGVGKFNGEEKIGLSNHINKIQYTSDSNVYTDITPEENYDDYVWFYSKEGDRNNIIQDSVRLELKEVNSFSFVNGTKCDPCSFNYGDRMYLTAREYYDFSYFTPGDYSDFNNAVANPTNNIIKSFIQYLTNDATSPPAMVGYFTNEPFYPYDLSKPIERIDDKNETNVTTNEIGKSEDYTYKVYHYVPSASDLWYYSSYSINAPIPEAVEYKDAKVYEVTLDSNGKEKLTDVSSKFMFLNPDNIISAIAKQNNNTTTGISNSISPDSGFYSKIYLMKINVKEKDYSTKSTSSEESEDKLSKTYQVDHQSSVGAKIVSSSTTLHQDTNPVSTNYKEIKIPITKVWNDNSNAAKLRPAEVTFNVKNPAGDIVSTGTIKSDTNKANSDYIPLRNENEEIIAYTVAEQPVTNYTGKVTYTRDENNILTGATITNTLSASFKITTRVDGTGGTISGSGQNPYETVEAGKNSTKDITITPNSGYQIKSITINSKTQQLPTNVKNPYTLNKFTNMYEDKEVVVQFEPIPKATGIVNYYLKGTEQKIKESKNLTNLTIGSNLAAETYKENIQHYTYDSASPSSITVNEDSSKNVLNLYYTLNKYGYTIEYYYDGVIDNSLTETGTAELNSEITYKPNTKNGTYILQNTNPSSGRIKMTDDSDKNIIKVYYVKKPEEPTTYTYSVEYYYDNVKDESATETGSAKLGDKITTYKDKSRNGTYELDSENTNKTVPLTIKETNNIMKIYYVKKPEEPNNVNYTIYYYYDGVKDETATDTGSAKINTEITYTEKNKNGTYKLVNVNPTSGKIQITEDEKKNIINVYYEKIKEETTDAKITTKYIDKETGKEISDSKTENTKIGEKYNTEKKDIEKYSYVSDSGNTTGTVDKPEIEVIYYYEPVREIIVKYVDKQTGEEIAEPSTNNGKTGDKFDITSKKQEINGYTLIEEPTEKEATYGKDPQTFTYYYAKNSKIIIRYVDEDTGEQIEKEVEKTGYIGETFDINGSEKNISGYYLVQEPKVKTGNYTENEQILTYYYRKDPGLANKPIPKTGMNEVVRNTSIIALLIVLSNGLRLFVRYKKEEKRSIK